MRVLVVEDERRLAAGLRAGLDAEGFAVDVALNGTDGLWMAREHPYDAIVLDIMLPGVNGYRLCSTLRARGDLDPDPHADRQGGRVGRGRGARHRRRRLPHQAVLVRGAGGAAAGAAAPRRPRAPGRARGRRPAPRPGRQAGLAGRAWRSSSPPASWPCWSSCSAAGARSCRSGRSSQHVWDDDFEGDPNIVEVYVRHLRNKLDRPFGRAAIQTVRGTGYRLVADGG